jgi:acyl-[acyl carrier protein]--UDP-N-acetylglucosamine O-acyltransferase
MITYTTIIGHDVCIERHCQISCNVVLAGGAVVGEGVFIGIAAGIRDHIHIGLFSIISMGAVVLKDVRPYKIVMGNPGRETGENIEQKVFK